MKICEFCGCENQDDAIKCTSCQGNSFKHRCNNCGTTFKEGAFCPHCGVRVGQKAKHCPQCHTEYYSNACPNCGYMPGQAAMFMQPQRTQHKALWVLGWIFIFPVPLTVLMLRNRTLHAAVRTIIIIAAWLAYFGLAAYGGANETETDSAHINDSSTISITQSVDE